MCVQLMVSDISKNYYVSGISPIISVNGKQNAVSGGNLRKDTFECTSLNRYTSKQALNKMIAANPKIAAVMKNIPLVLNMEDFNTLMQEHAKNTKNTAKGIIDNLPFALKNQVDEKAVLDAAYLHDIGKVLIPREILNKTGKLDKEEFEIMQKHSELGYEMLKTTNIDKKTLALIRNHHKNGKNSGYPFANKKFKTDLNLQILSTADKYSALTEKRAYKDSLSPKEALAVIMSEAKEEKLHPAVFNALVNYARKSASENNITAAV